MLLIVREQNRSYKRVIVLIMIDEFDHAWMRLELRHLAALDAVSRLGTFRGAATALGYSQSAVSIQIRALEEIVGATVLQRGPGAGHASPTAVGRALLGAIPSLVSAMDDARRSVEAAMQSRPVLRVGIFPTASVALLPGVLKLVGLQMEVVLHERPDPDELVLALRQGRLDVAFLSPPPVGSDLVLKPLLEDPYVVLLPRIESFDAVRLMSAERLRDLPAVAYRSLSDAVHPLMLLKPEYRPRRIAARTDDDRTVHAMVGAGLGVALLPGLSVDVHDPRVRTVPVRPALPPRRIVLAWQEAKHLEPAAEAFIRAAEAVAKSVRSTAEPARRSP